MTHKILKFQASWCMPCKIMTRQLESVDLGVPVEPVDIDDRGDLARGYEIRSVPTLVMLKDGTEVSRVVGVQSTEELRKWVSSCF